MLDNLGVPDWASLRDVRGSATRLPGQLRALLSPNADAAARARRTGEQHLPSGLDLLGHRRGGPLLGRAGRLAGGAVPGGHPRPADLAQRGRRVPDLRARREQPRSLPATPLAGGAPEGRPAAAPPRRQCRDCRGPARRRARGAAGPSGAPRRSVGGCAAGRAGRAASLPRRRAAGHPGGPPMPAGADDGSIVHRAPRRRPRVLRPRPLLCAALRPPAGRAGRRPGRGDGGHHAPVHEPASAALPAGRHRVRRQRGAGHGGVVRASVAAARRRAALCGGGDPCERAGRGRDGARLRTGCRCGRGSALRPKAGVARGDGSPASRGTGEAGRRGGRTPVVATSTPW